MQYFAMMPWWVSVLGIIVTVGGVFWVTNPKRVEDPWVYQWKERIRNETRYVCKTHRGHARNANLRILFDRLTKELSRETGSMDVAIHMGRHQRQVWMYLLKQMNYYL